MLYEAYEIDSLVVRPAVKDPSRIVTVAYCSFFALLTVASVLLMMADPLSAY